MKATRQGFLAVTVLVTVSMVVYGLFFRFSPLLTHPGSRQGAVVRAYPGTKHPANSTRVASAGVLRSVLQGTSQSAQINGGASTPKESQKLSNTAARQHAAQPFPLGGGGGGGGGGPTDLQKTDSQKDGGNSVQTSPNSQKTESQKDGGESGQASPNSALQPPPPKAAPSKLLCVSFSGRLGNQMFQYAAALGLARRLNRIAVYGGSSELGRALQHVPSTPNAGQYGARCRAGKRQWESKCCRLEEALLRLDPQYDYTVGQYLQSWKYFEGAEEEVKAAMKFKDAIQSHADGVVAELRKKHPNRTLVGVHVRRGDYLRNIHIKMGYRTAPASYFTDAMSFMRTRFGSVTFLVSTDDERWFRDSVTSGSDDVTILKRGDAAGDMALLASLDHVIISVGTYSWWVGYLNRGVTVFWKDFVAPGTEIGNQFLPKGETYIYPSWIPL